MGLIIHDNGKGAMRPTWWGRLTCQGKAHETNLGVPITGKPPVDENGKIALRLIGDEDFERSRKAAQKVLDKWRTECKRDPAKLQRKAYEVITGDSLDGLPLSQLANKWKSLKRLHMPDPTWADTITNWFNAFASFARGYAELRGNKCGTLNDITPDIAAAWFEKIKGEYSWETVRKIMSVLRSSYRRHATGGRPNPFEDIVVRNRETSATRVPHKPLTGAEVERLFEVSKHDEQMHPLIVTAACTGMRIGDVCRLKWADVDLRGGFIDCMTAKAGVRATIPIFGRLQGVLQDRATLSGDKEKPTAFVFPDAAAWYDRDDSAVCKAVKPYIARALDAMEDAETDTVDTGEDAETRMRIADAVNAANFAPQKRERIIAVVGRFLDGSRPVDIARELTISKSQATEALKAAEDLTGLKLRTATANRMRARTFREKVERLTKKERTVGKCRASVYGWHSLRATAVVLMIENGVPVADVQKIVGHTTAEMTMQYFNPEKRHAVERVRKQMRGTVLDGSSNERTTIGATVDVSADGTALAPAKPSVDDFISALTEDQRKELARKLLGL